MKHLGAAKVRLGEALASTDPERVRARLLDLTFELNEAETTHLPDHPELAKEIRNIRKRIEEVAMMADDEIRGAGGYLKLRYETGEMQKIIDEMVKLQVAEGAPELLSRGEAAMTAGEVSITPETVQEAIRHYEQEYKAPASISDIQFLLTIPHGSKVDREIDERLALAPPGKVQEAVDALFQEGKVRTTEFGGYVNPEYAAKPFNILEGRNESKMTLSTSDVGLVVGSSFAAKGLEKVVDFADKELGYSTLPLHSRLATWVNPILGAALVYWGWKGRGSASKTTAALVAGSHLLTQTVDTAESVATTGASGFTIRSYQPAAATPPLVSSRPLF